MFSAPQFARCLVLLFTSACLAVETIPVLGLGSAETRAAPPSPGEQACKHLKPMRRHFSYFHTSSYAGIRCVSGAAAAIVFCSSGRRGRGREKKPAQCRLSLHAIPKGPSEKRVGEGKGCGGSQKRGAIQTIKPLTHYLWPENRPRAERHLGYRCRAPSSSGSFPRPRCPRRGSPSPVPACCRRGP